MSFGAAIAVVAVCMYGAVSGFNDGGNLLASFTSGRVITPRGAAVLLLAALPGPLLVGYAVAATIATNIVDLEGQGPTGFALITATSFGVVLISWRVGIPTSMTLALVGAMVGWVLAGRTHQNIRLVGLARPLLGMPVSVLAGGVVALLLYATVRRLLGRLPHATLLSIAQAQLITAVVQAFAYGANDMEKTIGLLVVAAHFARPHQSLFAPYALATFIAFALFAIGALLGGPRVARRVGFGVLRIRPMQALAQQLSSGVVVVLFAIAGSPVSMTQTIDGGLVGVGAALRASAVRWNVVRDMVSSWMLTLPLALVLAALVHLVLRLSGLAP